MPAPACATMRLLVTAPDAAQAAALADALRDGGLKLAGHGPRHSLVRDAVRLAPQAVVLACDAWDAGAIAALHALADSAPRPVLVLGPALPPRDATTLLALNVHAWLPGPCQPALVAAALPLARARFAADQALARQLADAQARLDERKWIDRAKGVLMSHLQLDEESAFGLLRQASMQANLRVGEVSRGLLEASRAALAVNRGGQLRMLSQRLVLQWALRLALEGAGAANAGTDAHAYGNANASANASAAAESTHGALADTRRRLQHTLDELATLVDDAHAKVLLADAASAWQALARLPLDGLPDAAALAQADQLAEHLLASAEALTAALQTVGARRSLQVVNQCGRQRMLCQRLAKQALLVALLPQAQAEQVAAAGQTITAFESGLQGLAQAPLSNGAIRAALAQARAQWQGLLQGVRQSAPGHDPAGLLALAAGSDALLASFERLTTLYEHSLQVLLA